LSWFHLLKKPKKMEKIPGFGKQCAFRKKKKKDDSPFLRMLSNDENQNKKALVDGYPCQKVFSARIRTLFAFFLSSVFFECAREFCRFRVDHNIEKNGEPEPRADGSGGRAARNATAVAGGICASAHRALGSAA
jgi:hypothetical protein